MPTTESQSHSIAVLSDLDSETLRASGPYGRVYDLQLAYDRAEQHYDFVSYEVNRELSGKQPPLGSSTTDMFLNHPAIREAKAAVDEAHRAMRAGQDEVGGIVFLPALENLPEIEKRLTALNRKAGKIGTEQITLQLTDERLVLNYKTNDEDTRGYDFEHAFAVLSGATPKIPGFEFLATVTTTEHGNVVKRIPPIAYGVRHNLEWDAGHTDKGRKISDRASAAGQALDAIDLSRFHTTGDVCEHCHKERRRSDLFVVYNETSGEAKQVGRSCLRDFTGLNNPEQVLRVLEQVQEFIRYASSRGETPALSTEDFLIHCAALMRAEGGYVKGLGHEARRNYYNKLYDRRDSRTNTPLWVEPTDYDAHEARTAKAWLGEWDETSEFAVNVKLALAGEIMDAKLVGLGGAVYVARKKWIETAAQRAEYKSRQEAREAAKATKHHIGTVGQRETFTWTVTDIKWIADHYAYGSDATKPLIIMTDETGNEIKWFASDLPAVADKTQDNFPVIGGTYRVKATVKRHETSEDWGESTIVNRCKFEQTISEPEESDD